VSQWVGLWDEDGIQIKVQFEISRVVSITQVCFYLSSSLSFYHFLSINYHSVEGEDSEEDEDTTLPPLLFWLQLWVRVAAQGVRVCSRLNEACCTSVPALSDDWSLRRTSASERGWLFRGGNETTHCWNNVSIIEEARVEASCKTQKMWWLRRGPLVRSLNAWDWGIPHWVTGSHPMLSPRIGVYKNVSIISPKKKKSNSKTHNRESAISRF
jgi:hypothetical protein